MLWNASYFVGGLVITLSILIFVHELGHFLAAKGSGVRVERFSIGFGPKLIGFRHGHTEYVISAVPFGGYVRMAGEDPSGPTTGAEWEFMSKDKKTRAFIVASGPLMNFALSVVILTMLAAFVGVETITTRAIGRVEDGSPAESAGLRLGDEILSVGDRSVGNWDDIVEALEASLGKRVTLVFEREGSVETTGIDLSGIDSFDAIGIEVLREPVVGDVAWRGPAYIAGIRSGDRIIEVDGHPILTWSDLRQAVLPHPGDTLEIVWQRQGVTMSSKVVPKDANGYGLIEITPLIERHRVGPLRAFRLGFSMTIWAAKQIKHVTRFFAGLFSHDRTADVVGGPIRIGEVAGDALRWGLSNFLWFIALISAQLSIVNLIPIPVLDGGHILLLGIETVSRRPVTTRQRLIAHQIGFAFLLAFMLLVTFHDILRVAGR